MSIWRNRLWREYSADPTDEATLRQQEFAPQRLWQSGSLVMLMQYFRFDYSTVIGVGLRPKLDELLSTGDGSPRRVVSTVHHSIPLASHRQS